MAGAEARDAPIRCDLDRRDARPPFRDIVAAIQVRVAMADSPRMTLSPGVRPCFDRERLAERLREDLPPSTGTGTLVVVDDGDEGALEETLARWVGVDPLYVDFEGAPPGDVERCWPGVYGVRERLTTWIRRPAPWRVVLSSAPEWRPPLITDPGLLPDVPAPEALIAITAALGWRLPARTRPGLARIDGPISRLALEARLHLAAGRPEAAMSPLDQLLTRLPAWRGAWRLAAEAFTALGNDGDARDCHLRALPQRYTPTPGAAPRRPRA